jgi:beta-phosphoglucomutase-like phosphatase (HAD superfamily)
MNELINVLTVGVTGSGFGVKAALVAGMSAIGVVHDHVAYQDFGGADAVVESFSAKVADEAQAKAAAAREELNKKLQSLQKK